MKPGFGIIDALISIGVLAILVTSIYPIISATTARTKQVKYQGDAALAVQEGVEATYNVFLTNWTAASTGRYAVISSSSPNAWALQSLAPNTYQTVNNNYQRVVVVSSWCRNSATGDLQKPASFNSCQTEPELTLVCNGGGGYVADAYSKVITGIVKWKENTQTLCISSSTLVSKL